jgi:hypothetical protein
MTAVFVFSHPNHEVSVLGMICRKRPHIIFLTDGGGERRVQETMRGLSRFLPSGHLHFLDRTEESLYRALVNRDDQFYCRLASDVGVVLQALQPQEAYCDAVEFYNPVHDMALPVVRIASRELGDVALFEGPLVYEKASEPSSVELQRVPPSLADRANFVHLTEHELRRKTDVLSDGTYGALMSQLGPLISDALPTRGQIECYLKARDRLPAPEPDQLLRYDVRGRLLQATGDVRSGISYREHYVPMVHDLRAFSD